VFSLHGAAGDEGDRAFLDDDLVGEELMTLGFAGVEADYKEGVVVAVVFKSSNCESGGACLGGFDQFGFALLQSAAVWTVGSVVWEKRGCVVRSARERMMRRCILTPWRDRQIVMGG
jgi:hypothetical protein